MIENSEFHLINMIVRKTATVQDTRLYWNRVRMKLKTMIYDLICFSLFFTLNVTDLQWCNLYAYMSDREMYMTASENERVKIAWRLLQKNSHIIIECLKCRVMLFMKLVIKKKFKIQNFWYCFEWQSHESKHIHEFLWINNALNVTDLDQYLSFWDV